MIFLINTLLLYIPLLALTHRRNYGETNNFFSAKPTSTHTNGKKAWISVSGYHETRSTGSPNSGKTPVDRVSCPDMKIRVFPECEFPWTGFHLGVRTWNPVHGNSHSGKTWISVSGHETRSTGQIDVLLFLPRVQLMQNHPIFMQNWMYRIWM